METSASGRASPFVRQAVSRSASARPSSQPSGELPATGAAGEGAALVCGTSAVIYTLLPGGQGMAVFMGVLGIAHGAYSVYLGYAHSECFGG